MSRNEAFIQDILAHPDDLGLRLIYADWLDEQNDPRGTFLRVEAAYRALPEEDERRPALLERLREMGQDLDARWRTRLDLPVIENCAPEFEFVCPKRWQDLDETANAGQRFCAECRKIVHYCGSVEDARSHAWRGQCVAVDTRQERHPGDLRPPMLMGVLAPPSDRRGEELSRGQHVTLIGGVHDGVDGEIVRVHPREDRVTVRVEVNGKSTLLTVDVDSLEVD